MLEDKMYLRVTLSLNQRLTFWTKSKTQFLQYKLESICITHTLCCSITKNLDFFFNNTKYFRIQQLADFKQCFIQTSASFSLKCKKNNCALFANTGMYMV
jgi:hypothetical protein